MDHNFSVIYAILVFTVRIISRRRLSFVVVYYESFGVVCRFIERKM